MQRKWGAGGAMPAETGIPSASLHVLADSTREPAVLVDASGRVVWANRAFRGLSGYDAGCCEGQSLVSLLGFEDGDACRMLERALAAEAASELDLAVGGGEGAGGRWLDIAVGACDAAHPLRPVHLRDVTAARRQADALARAEALCEHTALHDPLTGLPNRRGLLRHLGEIMRRAEEEHRRIGICLIDLDRFRVLNETRGHQAGDEMLVECAERLRRLAEPGQTLARIGSDLFAMVAPGLADVGAFDAKARRLRNALSCDVTLAGGPWRLSARMGLAVAEPGETDPATLLTHAEVALADAKASPDGDVGLFSPTVGQRFADRSRLADEIRLGLERAQFQPFFQPQVRLADGRLEGFEALVRWHHPERGLLEPCHFLEAAEKLGLEMAIDTAMIEGALDGLVAMRAAGHAVDRISINLSARSMRDADRVDLLGWALERRDLAPQDVVVEVVESTLIVDSADPAAINIDRLAREGFRVELDDFGTGYSALSNVARLNIHALKIDRSLIQLMLGHQASAVVVNAIVALARQIGIAVIAEGVETEAEAEALTRLGCDLGQGYWFSRPLALDQALLWLDRQRRVEGGARRLAG